MLLSLYRACSAALAPLAPPFLLWRARMRRARLRPEDRLRSQERLAKPSLPRPHGRLAWLHGAAAADIAPLIPLIERLGAAGFAVLVTTRDDGSTPIRLPPTALHQCAPLDAPRFVKPFLAYWRPDVALFAASEFWPNFISESRKRGLPINLINARLSARAFLFWRKLPGVARDLFGGVDLCLARSEADAQRFRFFGASCAQAAGDPIYDLAPSPADAAALARLLARIGARPVWAAFPAGALEEDIVIEAHQKIARNFPDLLTIIAPRHAKRGFDVALRAGRLGLDARVATAADHDSGALPAIHIAGAGDAGLFYRATGVIFLGKSLRGGGGINPVEAAKLGCAILHGPDVDDFEEVYAAVDGAGGGAVVNDAQALASEASLLLFDAAELRAMGRAAADEVERLGGASWRIMQALAPYLAQIFVRPEIEDEAES
ncbi:Three-deoxy-D-manno-octulosonic-acid transferase domain protein [Methylocella tundrae]|uniref:3-deoxy-D-manno-octulosonic acid transferase n=1 Tax=Methylocella tundrae TaxID=227605 RepID=A0A8B6M5H3_METTU|nr:glycosyltransferase N-terminal domain-containing protein [Methylocella tundrae]VTZ50078.1 Three-deoxy-D-manno-octulosonic-acid transferase domain protein [Methylocella tundrae]